MFEENRCDVCLFSGLWCALYVSFILVCSPSLFLECIGLLVQYK